MSVRPHTANLPWKTVGNLKSVITNPFYHRKSSKRITQRLLCTSLWILSCLQNWAEMCITPLRSAFWLHKIRYDTVVILGAGIRLFHRNSSRRVTPTASCQRRGRGEWTDGTLTRKHPHSNRASKPRTSTTGSSKAYLPPRSWSRRPAPTTIPRPFPVIHLSTSCFSIHTLTQPPFLL